MTGLRTKAGAGAAVVLALGMGAAYGQPTAKSHALSEETRDLLWCSVMFFEESFWHDVESPEEVYYNELSLDLDELAFEGMREEALTDEQAWELWEFYADAAFILYEEDNADFRSDLADCDTRHGSGGPATPSPTPGAGGK